MIGARITKDDRETAPSCTFVAFVINQVTIESLGTQWVALSYARVESLNGVRPFHLHPIPHPEVR